MRNTVNLAVLISVLAGCAAPMPTLLTTPSQPQSVPALTAPVAAAAKAPAIAAPGKALVSPAAAKPAAQAATVTVAPLAAKAPLLAPAVTPKAMSLNDFDPMTVLSALPANVPSAPEDA